MSDHKTTPATNTDSLLAAWTAIEVLTAGEVPTRRSLQGQSGRRLIPFQGDEPWSDERYEKKAHETQVSWHIYLGRIERSRATEVLLDKFGEKNRDERNLPRGETPLANFTLNATGHVVPSSSFLPSFPWAYGRVMSDDYTDLDRFSAENQDICEGLEEILLQRDDQGQPQPLTANVVEEAFEWLKETLNLLDEEVSPGGTAIRIVHEKEEPPEPYDLNSFFLNDLSAVRKAFSQRKKTVGTALRMYLNDITNKRRVDVVKQQDKLKEMLAPKRFPLTRWPSRGRPDLFLMQQAAVNHVADELAESGLVAVNGPPGTGKTTLLRDVVAKVVLDRAKAMSKFDDPASAYTHAETMHFPGGSRANLYSLPPELLGHEIVVACSTNKAAENISREIPSVSAIADDFDPPLRYFSFLSDAVHRKRDATEAGTTWGLAAAALGSFSNRNTFVNRFWWGEQDMQKYLKAIYNKQEASPQTHSEEPPQDKGEALERWKMSRADFLEKLERVEKLQGWLQNVYEAVNREARLKKKNRKAQRAFRDAIGRVKDLESQHGAATRACEMSKERVQQREDEQGEVKERRPTFFIRWFRRKEYALWRAEFEANRSALQRARKQFDDDEDSLRQIESDLGVSKGDLKQAKKQRDKSQSDLEQTQKIIEREREALEENLGDARFWASDPEKLQKSCPWLTDDLQRAREDLFAASFRLHKAFIDASASQIRHNLIAIMAVIGGRQLDDKQASVRRSLWASLFMVVPVISTTFASTSSLFNTLENEELGWLLIDEAGQVTPQAAVGALWRARRAVIIGDPFQLEPIVEMPDNLTTSIFKHYGPSDHHWAAPAMSAQTLADRVSRVGTIVTTVMGDVWVGSPLRVHRRCQRPMFSIANAIAYDNQMIYATPPGDSRTEDVIGPTRWLHLESQAQEKWSEDEGRAAVTLLLELFKEQQREYQPSVFVITPFRIVSENLRKLIGRNSALEPSLSSSWTQEHVGTIHTFQGREADAVILVLGASGQHSGGARRWAGEKPNLLNVAVTRAKHNLYVVGNRTAWKSAGVFSDLAQKLEHEDWTGQVR